MSMYLVDTAVNMQRLSFR